MKPIASYSGVGARQRAPVRGQDRHRRPRHEDDQQQRRLDGRLHAAGQRRGVGRHRHCPSRSTTATARRCTARTCRARRGSCSWTSTWPGASTWRCRPSSSSPRTAAPRSRRRRPRRRPTQPSQLVELAEADLLHHRAASRPRRPPPRRPRRPRRRRRHPRRASSSSPTADVDVRRAAATALSAVAEDRGRAAPCQDDRVTGSGADRATRTAPELPSHVDPMAWRGARGLGGAVGPARRRRARGRGGRRCAGCWPWPC